MAILDKIRLSGTTYDIIDSTAIHSLDGYWTTGETTAAITAATNALAESIAEQNYATTGYVQEAIAEASGVTTGQVQTMIDDSISGKADTTAVTQSINEATSGKVDNDTYTAFTSSTDTALAGKANTGDVVTNVSDADDAFGVHISVTKGGTASTKTLLRVGSGLTWDNSNKIIKIDGDIIPAKSEIPSVSGYADSVKYNSTSKYVEFYHGGTGGTKVFEYDASPFLIDGMVQNVEIKDVEISGETVTCLVVSFNTDAGKQDINIPLTDIFDASNYYTKTEVDAALSAKSDSSAVTEEISAAVSGKVDNDTYTAFTSSTDTALAGKANTGDVVTDVYGSVQEVEGQIILQVSKTKGNYGNNVVRVNFDTSGFTWDSQNNFLDINTNNIATTGYVASATSGKADSSMVDSLSGTVTAHTANTDIHVTTSDKTTWSGKQDALVSGTNIKTINGASILGAGNISTLQVEVSGTTLVFS